MKPDVDQIWCKVWEVVQSEYIQNITVQEVALHNKDIGIQYQLCCVNRVALAG